MKTLWSTRIHRPQWIYLESPTVLDPGYDVMLWFIETLSEYLMHKCNHDIPPYSYIYSNYRGIFLNARIRLEKIRLWTRISIVNTNYIAATARFDLMKKKQFYLLASAIASKRNQGKTDYFLWPKAEGPYANMIRRSRRRLVIFLIVAAIALSLVVLFRM